VFVGAPTTLAAESDSAAKACRQRRPAHGVYLEDVPYLWTERSGDRKMGTKAVNPRLFLSTVFLSTIQPREH
jgi:hypothetical protein